MALKHDGFPFPSLKRLVPASKETLGGRQMSKEQLTALMVLLALRLSDGTESLGVSGSEPQPTRR